MNSYPEYVEQPVAVLWCDSCSLLFGTSFAPDIRGRGTWIANVQFGQPCPRCGRWAIAKALDEPVHLTDNEWMGLPALLRPAGATAEDYERLAAALRAADEAGKSPAEAAEAVAHVAPRFADLIEFLQSYSGPIGVVLMVLGLILSGYNAVKPTTPPSPPPIVVNNYYYPAPDPEQIHREVERALRDRDQQRQQRRGR